MPRTTLTIALGGFAFGAHLVSPSFARTDCLAFDSSVGAQRFPPRTTFHYLGTRRARSESPDQPAELTMEHASSPSTEVLGGSASSVGASRLQAQTPAPVNLDAQAQDHRRIGIRVRTSCSAVLQANGRASHCRAIQMSTSGVILSGGASLSGGQRGTLHIYLNARRPVTFTVQAVRKIGPLQAFEFVNLRDADRLALAEFLDQFTGP